MFSKKIAYIEYNKVHQEIIPIFVYLAKINNIKIDIFLLNDNLNNNVFYYIDRNNFNNFEVKSIDNLEKEIKKNKYDISILGSGETNLWINDFLNLNIPNKLIIRHNYTYYKYGDHKIKEIVLGEHILKLNNNLISIYPIYFGNFDYNLRKQNYYLIQGNLEYKRRNYLSLINCCLELKQRHILSDRVKFIILGRFSQFTNKDYPVKLDGNDFLQRINNNNIKSYFEFVYDATEYIKYFEIINQCKYILPLIDETYNHKYFQNKTTSSINIGIGFKQTFIINETIADVYKINGIKYKKSNILEGILTSLEDNKNYNNYEYFLETNLSNFNNIIR